MRTDNESWWSKFLRTLFGTAKPPEPQRPRPVQVLPPKARRPQVRPLRVAPGARRALHIQCDKSALLRQRGWREDPADRTVLTGTYQTPYGSWSGEIETKAGRPHFFILDPPEALKKSTHWSCFHLREHGKYFVHFAKQPKDIDAGIAEIERLLVEALQRR